MPVKIGLNSQKKIDSGAVKSTAQKNKPLFDEDDSDDGEQRPANSKGFVGLHTFDDSRSHDLELEQTPSATNGKPSKSKSVPLATVDLSTLRAQQKQGAEAEAIDPNIYDYDAAYDAIHARKVAKKAAELADAAERKPKYMSNLLEAAEIRKHDQLRAQDKLLQRERDAEGDEFADKEKFVTEAYKEQQKEMKKMEEIERKMEAKEAERRKKVGMTGFFRTVMDEEEKRHQDAVEAAVIAKASDDQDEGVPEEKTAAQLAQEMNEKGANVIMTEEGQVADKRQLLTAGLNLVPKAKPKSQIASSDSKSERSRPDHSAFGRGGAKHAMRERQTRMIEVQLEQAAKRAAEAETVELQRVERAAKSRKTENEVSDAKERYLQRKREAAAARTGASTDKS